MTKLKFVTDIEKSVIKNNFEARGWILANLKDDWNIFWASPQSTRMIFNPESAYRFSEKQVHSFKY